MLWFLILGVFAALLVVALARSAPHQGDDPVMADCVRCDGPASALTGEEPRSYEVLACPACKFAWTLVHHVPNRLTYCPSCQNRAMDARCANVVPHPDGLQVDVEERCHLCGHSADLLLSAPRPRPMGKILPFPQGPSDRR